MAHIKNKTMTLLELSNILLNRKKLMKRGDREGYDSGEFANAFDDMFDFSIDGDILERDNYGNYTGIGSFNDIDGDKTVIFKVDNVDFIGKNEIDEDFNFMDMNIKVVSV